MMLPSRVLRSSRSLARQKIAITSEATVMSKPSSRGKPLATPPSEETIWRRVMEEVASEVQIDVLHRHDLGIAATGRAALHAERGPEARLAQAQHRLLADVVERVGQPDRGGGLALA